MAIRNPEVWDILGEKQMVYSAKKKFAKVDRRMAAELRKKEEKDEAEQLSLYKSWKREVRKELQIRYGKQLEQLIKMLKNLSLDSASGVTADELVVFIEKSSWLINADEHSRMTILSYIDDAIIKVRIRHGLPAFDDPIPSFDGTPDEDDNAFIIIKRLLTGV